MATSKTYPSLTANEAAGLIPNGAMVAVSGFTPAGAPKAVPRALAKRARELHQAGTAFQVKLLSGASTGEACDDELAGAEAVSWRAPYITSAPMRQLANTGKIEFVDMHLSHVAQAVMEGFLGTIDFAIIEATEITPDGKVYLTTGIGNSPTFLGCAEKVIIELNSYHSPRLREITDILILPTPPRRTPTPIHDPLDRLGRDYATVDPSKVIAVVHTNERVDGRSPHRMSPADESPNTLPGFSCRKYAVGEFHPSSSRFRVGSAISVMPCCRDSQRARGCRSLRSTPRFCRTQCSI
jgi:acyl-CoA hydrolase